MVGGAVVGVVVSGRDPIGTDYAVVFVVAAVLFAATAALAAWRVPRVAPPVPPSPADATVRSDPG